jgi:hypothetical protein
MPLIDNQSQTVQNAQGSAKQIPIFQEVLIDSAHNVENLREFSSRLNKQISRLHDAADRINGANFIPNPNGLKAVKEGNSGMGMSPTNSPDSGFTHDFKATVSENRKVIEELQVEIMNNLMNVIDFIEKHI